MKENALATLLLIFTALLTTETVRADEESAFPLSLLEEQFEKLHQLIQPRESELSWQQIPWHPDLWTARREAARAGKPIYLWEMDGHPLGCT